MDCKYQKIADKISSITYYQNKNNGLNFEDYLSICYESYLSALKNYETGSNYFKAYWEKIVSNQLKKKFIENNKERKINNICLDSKISSQDGLLFEDIIGKNDDDISNIFIHDDLKEILFDNPISILTDEEKIVIMAKIFNKPFSKVAIDLNSNIKHVRYVYKKAKGKLEFLKKHF